MTPLMLSAKKFISIDVKPPNLAITLDQIGFGTDFTPPPSACGVHTCMEVGSNVFVASEDNQNRSKKWSKNGVKWSKKLALEQQLPLDHLFLP
jgi:hypothetical protein